MQIGKRNDGWSKGMFWAAMGLVPLSILSSGHGPLERFVTGSAAAMFLVCVVRMARCRGLWLGKRDGEEKA
jgi:hypothetical protein